MRYTAAAAMGFMAVLCASTQALANGFFLYELSPGAAAQGGATAAEGKEPATLAFNPGGMARLKGLQLQANLYTYVNSNTYESPTGERTSAKTGVFPIPSFFATYKPVDWMALGVGSYSIYGLTVSWPDRWAGYHLVKKASLRSYQVQPTVAFGPFKGLSIGAGLDVVFGSVELTRGLALGNGAWGTSTIAGNTTGFGGTFGVFYDAAEWLKLGATWRTGLKMKLDPGKADFNVPPAFDQTLRDQKVRTSLSLPHIVQAGVRVLPTKNLALETDVTWLGWRAYDRLVFSFDDPALNQTQETNWHNALEFRIGAQYDLDKVALRAGFLFDQTPIPDATLDPMLPDNHRLIPSVGGGYAFTEWLRADAGYMFVYLVPRTVDANANRFPGRYEGIVHTFLLGATARL